MVPLAATAREGRLIADYDDDADVLYLSLGAAVPSESEEDPAGVVLRWSIQSGEPSGATVVGYRCYSWSGRLPDLTSLVVHHLHVSANEAEQAIKKATTPRRLVR
jgi:hypothetical protein